MHLHSPRNFLMASEKQIEWGTHTTFPQRYFELKYWEIIQNISVFIDRVSLSRVWFEGSNNQVPGARRAPHNNCSPPTMSEWNWKFQNALHCGILINMTCSILKVSVTQRTSACTSYKVRSEWVRIMCLSEYCTVTSETYWINSCYCTQRWS